MERRSYFTEHVCANCPGTLWGEKSICRVHQMSIGEIEDCPEWEHHETPKNDHDGQLAFFDIEPAIEIVQQVEEDIKSYHWLVKEVDRLDAYLCKVEYGGRKGGSSGVAQYGIEATLPKPKGDRPAGIKITEELYAQKWDRLKKIQDKINRIHSAIGTITDEKEKAVLDCMLDGWRMNRIARHVNVSRQRLNEIKRSVTKKLAWELYGEQLQAV